MLLIFSFNPFNTDGGRHNSLPYRHCFQNLKFCPSPAQYRRYKDTRPLDVREWIIHISGQDDGGVAGRKPSQPVRNAAAHYIKLDLGLLLFNPGIDLLDKKSNRLAIGIIMKPAHPDQCIRLDRVRVWNEGSNIYTILYHGEAPPGTETFQMSPVQFRHGNAQIQFRENPALQLFQFQRFNIKEKLEDRIPRLSSEPLSHQMAHVMIGKRAERAVEITHAVSQGQDVTMDDIELRRIQPRLHPFRVFFGVVPPNRIRIFGEQTPQQAHDHPKAQGLARRGKHFDLLAEALQVPDILRHDLFGRLNK